MAFNTIMNIMRRWRGLPGSSTLPSVVIFITILFCSVHADCPTSCICNATMDSVIVDCQSQGLAAIPLPLPDNITHLYLRDNDIDDIRDLEAYMDTLIVIDMSWNRVESIPKCFCSINGCSGPSTISNLFLFDISYNRLESILARTFEPCHALSFLDLSGNKIELITTDSFPELYSIQELRLHNNKIAWGNLAFTGLNTLEVLDLSSNKLFRIVDDLFADQHNLTTLALQRNNILNISQNAFKSLKKLRTLDLSYNPFTSLPGTLFDKLKRLEYLQMSADSLVDVASVAIVHKYDNQWYEAMIRLANSLQDSPYFRKEDGNFTQQNVGIKFIETIDTVTTYNTRKHRSVLSDMSGSLVQQQSLTNL